MTSDETNIKSKKHEIIGLGLIGLGVLCALPVYFGVNSVFGTAARGLVFGLGGIIGYSVPVLLCFIGWLFIAAKARRLNRTRQLLWLLVLTLVFTMCHLPSIEQVYVDGMTYAAFLVDSFVYGSLDGAGGGILGALLSYGLYLLLGSIGSWIVCIVGSVACVVALTNLSLKQLSNDLSSAVRNSCRDFAVKNEEHRLEREQSRKKRRAEDLYVESLRAEKQAARRAQIEDPFDLRIQSFEPKSRGGRRKRFARQHLESTAEDVLDLRVFEPHETSERSSFSVRIEPIPTTSKADNGQGLYSEVSEKSDSSCDNLTAPPGCEKRDLKSEVAATRPDAEMKEELPWEPSVTAPDQSEIRQTQQTTVPYHVETGKHRAGTAAILAADDDGVVRTAEHAEDSGYVFPPIELLDPQVPSHARSRDVVQRTASRLEETLLSFHIEAHVVNILQGPVVTRYELQPAPGIKVSKIVRLADDIALALAAKSIRIEAPVPGKSVIGIEIPNAERDTVGLRELLSDPKFVNMKSPVAFALGKDITGTNVFADIAKMPHLLVAGQTGSGKSVCINSLIVSLLYHTSPDDVRLLMIDPKVVELSVFNNIPHLIAPVVTDPKKANLALNWAVAEMESRYREFATRNVKELKRFNEVLEADDEKRLPHVVVIVDELADLMMTASQEVEEAITRIAQKGRAAGIHLVIATQRPTVNVVTGLIKANVPARVALSVKSSIDSKTILDTVGAEKLLGYGDMLFYTTGLPNPERIQGCWVSDQEVERVAEFLYRPADEIYDSTVQDSIDNAPEQSDEPGDRDALFRKAVEVAVESEGASTSLLQRRLKIGYSRAARLIDQMEGEGIVSGQNGSKPRQVLISRDDYERIYGGNAS